MKGGPTPPPTAGYSGTPLLRKLGYRDGQRAILVGVPDELVELSSFPGFAHVERLVTLGTRAPKGPFDLAHLFETDRVRLADALERLRPALDPAGMIWVSWPKKAAKVPTSITEDVIREIALPTLVDVKVAAVSDIWSGLKLVIPVALRKRRPAPLGGARTPL